MRAPIRQSRPHRISPVARRLPRPVVRWRAIARSERALSRLNVTRFDTGAARTGFQPDPYIDYGRFLTPDGGVRIIYKDLDLRLRHTIWRIFAWTAATGYEIWLLFYHSPVQSIW